MSDAFLPSVGIASSTANIANKSVDNDVTPFVGTDNQSNTTTVPDALQDAIANRLGHEVNNSNEGDE